METSAAMEGSQPPIEAIIVLTDSTSPTGLNCCIALPLKNTRISWQLTIVIFYSLVFGAVATGKIDTITATAKYCQNTVVEIICAPRKHGAIDAVITVMAKHARVINSRTINSNIAHPYIFCPYHFNDFAYTITWLSIFLLMLESTVFSNLISFE